MDMQSAPPKLSLAGCEILNQRKYTTRNGFSYLTST